MYVKGCHVTDTGKEEAAAALACRLSFVIYSREGKSRAGKLQLGRSKKVVYVCMYLLSGRKRLRNCCSGRHTEKEDYDSTHIDRSTKDGKI